GIHDLAICDADRLPHAVAVVAPDADGDRLHAVGNVDHHVQAVVTAQSARDGEEPSWADPGPPFRLAGAMPAGIRLTFAAHDPNLHRAILASWASRCDSA